MVQDAVIIGGGFAGLAAATYLGRARASVRVFDTALPRNRFAKASHGFLGHDGRSPLDILADARAQLLGYPSVTLSSTGVEAVAVGPEAFTVRTADGEAVAARKLILAFGLRDELPPIPGLAERWGHSVIHCPYCHGYEFADRRLGVLYRLPASTHQARLVARWGPTTLFLDGHPLEDADREALDAAGVAIEPRGVRALMGRGRDLSGLMLADGSEQALDALYIAPRSVHGSPLAAQLGLAIDDGPMGPVIRTDADQMTSIAGIYAAGDIARAPHSVSWAVADGVTAATAAHRALVFGR